MAKNKDEVTHAITMLVGNYNNPNFTPKANQEQGVEYGNIIIEELNRLEEIIKDKED